jgi:tetratricopeptide (TPR) repeat protein
MKSFLRALIILALVSGLSAAADDYYSRENLCAFAGHLFTMGDYERAIGEYLRAAALSEKGIAQDSLWYRIAVAYLLLSRPADARRFCDRIQRSASDSSFFGQMQGIRAFSYYQQKKFDSAEICGTAVVQDPVWQGRLAQIRIAALLKQYRWREAVIETEKVENDAFTRTLREIGSQGTSLRYKTPAVAGALSAVLPGSGKLYAHRGLDGLYSLLLVGVTAWQAYEGYRKDGLLSVRCATFGTLGCAFYTGNVYGSVIAARQFNASKRAVLAERVILRFDW